MALDWVNGANTSAAYASFVNVLDYTNVVIPVTSADSKIDLFDHHYKPLNEKDKKNWQACKYLGVQSMSMTDSECLLPASTLLTCLRRSCQI